MAGHLPGDRIGCMDEQTDRQALEALLARFGLVAENVSGSLTLVAKNGGVDGYSGFVAEFQFDGGGKFMGVGIYE
jgi:hypothetical protein